LLFQALSPPLLHGVDGAPPPCLLGTRQPILIHLKERRCRLQDSCIGNESEKQETPS